MKEMKGPEMNATSCISSSISRCKKGFYESVSFDPKVVVNIIWPPVEERKLNGSIQEQIKGEVN
ncbi:MAG: hypothetical protein JSW62_05615 [Thermoplasmatales archaeon]|nr:MAG: hypothetical protein JSW62_05615 [Thermoplasmatales archaeon]